MADASSAWHLRGSVVVACNCDYGCPCNFNALPTKGHCEGGWTWHVDSGASNGTDLSSLNFSMYGDWPRAIHEGGGDAYLLIDERADATQRDIIERFLRGEIGGPWAILKTTFSTIFTPHYVPYQVTIGDKVSTVQAGDLPTVATEPVRNPVTGAESLPRITLPQGFIFKEGAMLRTSDFRVSGDVAFDHTGQYAAVGPFEYKPA
jgi:hypothetical protein